MFQQETRTERTNSDRRRCCEGAVSDSSAFLQTVTGHSCLRQATGNDAPLPNLSTTNVHTLLQSLEHISKAQWSSEQNWSAEVQPLIINLRTVLSRRHPTDTSTDLQAIPSLDPFNNTLDFTSEARVKKEVFGLNDSLGNLIMTILEGAKQVIGQSPVRLRTPSFKQHQKAAVARLSGKKESPLFFCLQNERHTDETRGFLLDVLLHGRFVDLIFRGLFDCHVVSNAFDSSRMLEDLWDTVRQQGKLFSRASINVLTPLTLSQNHGTFLSDGEQLRRPRRHPPLISILTFSGTLWQNVARISNTRSTRHISRLNRDMFSNESLRRRCWDCIPYFSRPIHCP